MGEAHCSPSMYEQSSAACIPILQPGSPPQTREGVRCAYAPLCSPMEADVKLLSGSKRSCEGYTLLADEAEADDASMVGVAPRLSDVWALVGRLKLGARPTCVCVL